jgi:hypothetical protein
LRHVTEPADRTLAAAIFRVVIGYSPRPTFGAPLLRRERADVAGMVPSAVVLPRAGSVVRSGQHLDVRG